MEKHTRDNLTYGGAWLAGSGAIYVLMDNIVNREWPADKKKFDTIKELKKDINDLKHQEYSITREQIKGLYDKISSKMPKNLSAEHQKDLGEVLNHLYSTFHLYTPKNNAEEKYTQSLLQDTGNTFEKMMEESIRENSRTKTGDLGLGWAVILGLGAMAAHKFYRAFFPKKHKKDLKIAEQ